MNVKDSYSKKVTFDTKDGLEDKIDNLTTMMGKLVVRDGKVSRLFKPQIHQSKRRGQVEIFMIHIIMTEEIIKIGTGQIMDKIEIDQGMDKIIGEEILGAMPGHIKILVDRIVEENIEVIIGMKITVQREVGVGLEKDHFQGIIIVLGIREAQVIADQGLDQG